MKVLVLSDSHGDAAALQAALKKESAARTVIFLGDGAREAERLQTEDPCRMWHIVCGNCDIGVDAPPCRLLTLGGVPLYVTHGHNERVKSGLLTLTYSALEQECAVALYGHTHIPSIDFRDGVVLMNPGSIAGTRTYGVLEIEAGRVLPSLHRL